MELYSFHQHKIENRPFFQDLRIYQLRLGHNLRSLIDKQSESYLRFQDLFGLMKLIHT
jgi:hypothetical protein